MWCTHSWALPISFLSRVLEALTRKFTLHQDVSLYSIARKCPPNFTGADMYALCADAWFHAAKRKVGRSCLKYGSSRGTAGQKCIADDFVWFTILKLNGIYRDPPPPPGLIRIFSFTQLPFWRGAYIIYFHHSGSEFRSRISVHCWSSWLCRCGVQWFHQGIGHLRLQGKLQLFTI